MADNVFQTPYQTYHRKSYAGIDPTQPALSTKSKSAVVTGAGSDIGARIAISLAKSAISYMALIGRREHALLETKLGVEAASISTKVYTYAVEIANLTAVDAALDAALDEFRQRVSLRDVDPLEWWDGFEINIKGNFNLVHAFLAKASRTSAIIQMSSGVVHGPHFLNESSYCASKAGAVKLFEYVHHEHPEIFVLCLHPGLVAETGMSPRFENIANGTQVDMASLPWDNVALPGDLTVWAVSSEARFLNGRFVWANWDVGELKDDQDAIVANPNKFTLGLLGNSG